MRVLIADDDADVREVLVESFRDAGFEVLQASNGLEALLHAAPPASVEQFAKTPR